MVERIRRTFDFEMTRADEPDDSVGGLVLEGYAAVFNDWTEIHGEGPRPFMERIAPGAFANTLSQRTPVMQFDHGTHPLVGSIPIGVPTVLREDERGLFVRGRLHDNWLIEPVRDAIRDGSISGMSFRFSVPKNKDTWTDDDGVRRRTINEAVLYELGPVVWPAYEGTSVGVRSELAAMLTDPLVQRDLARVLAFGQVEDFEGTASGIPTITDEPQECIRRSTREARQIYRRYFAQS